MRILIAEDDATSARLLEMTLLRDGFEVAIARDGAEALEMLHKESYDALLTDWMMPRMDGIALIRGVRAQIEPVPILIVVTALVSGDAKSHAFEAGADDYLTKPYDPSEVSARIHNCFARRHQPEPKAPDPAKTPIVPAVSASGFPVVVMATSTGGPESVRKLVHSLRAPSPAALLLVMHGPSWMLESYVPKLRQETSLEIELAEDGMRVQPNHLYVAPGDRHMVVESDPLHIRLTEDPPENFVRPAADPLFSSVAEILGAHTIGVVLTGMGRDGSLGASAVNANGGMVLVQDPRTAVAPAMPQTVINLGQATQVVPLEEMAATLQEAIERAARAPMSV